MNATEAAKLADVIQRGAIIYAKDSGGNWRDRHGYGVNLNEKESNDYTPLVPLKTYKVGDAVTFAEALQSGMCFKYSLTTYRVENGLLKLWNGSWQDCLHPVNAYMGIRYTIVADPSVPKKPTIEDLEPWTHFKALINGVEFECVKQPNSYCAHPFWHISGSQWWSNSLDATLTHIKNAAGEWEEV